MEQYVVDIPEYKSSDQTPRCVNPLLSARSRIVDIKRAPNQGFKLCKVAIQVHKYNINQLNPLQACLAHHFGNMQTTIRHRRIRRLIRISCLLTVLLDFQLTETPAQ